MAMRVKTITAGRMVRCIGSTVPKYYKDDSPHVRDEKRRSSSEWQTQHNRRRSCDKLEELIYCNFGHGDLYVTLTYREECLPATRRQVLLDFRLFRKRLAELRSARGETTDYIYIIEHKHGEGRWHIHLLLRGTGEADREEISRCWRKGYAFVKFFELYNAEGLAHYLAKEAPDGVGDHMWIASRGLRRPIITSELVPDGTRIAPPYGAIIRAEEYEITSWGPRIYFKYFLAA